MERWQSDTIGPVPADEDGRGLSWYPIKDTTAQSCVDAMIQHVGTFGTPRQILTDNGIEFVNELVAELLKITGVQHLTILPYSKEEIGMVEKANREVMRHLRNLVFAHNGSQNGLNIM
jgi:transposase InsO family protein